MSETKPIAHRIMAAWMRLQGHSEDEIADTRPDSIEEEIEALEVIVRGRVDDARPHPLSTCPDCGDFRGHGHDDVCPMAWVTQHEVDPRQGVDQVRWGNWPAGLWVDPVGVKLSDAHDEDAPSLHVRCRRKDLPPVPDRIDTCPLCGVVRGREYEHVCESKPDPSSPFGDAMSQPANRVPVRLEWTYPIGPLRLICDDGTAAISGMLRCDASGFYIERGE